MMRPVRRILVLIGKVRVRSLIVKRAPLHQSDPYCAASCPAPLSGADVASL